MMEGISSRPVLLLHLLPLLSSSFVTSGQSGLFRITKTFFPPFLFLPYTKTMDPSFIHAPVTPTHLQIPSENSFFSGIPSFFQLATVLGHFSTVPQLLPVLGLASGSHAGYQTSHASLTIIGNLTPILETVNVKRSFEVSSKKMPESVLLANSC